MKCQACRGLVAVVVLLVGGSFVLAGNYTGVVTKVSKDEVTIKYRKSKDSDFENHKLKLDKNTKFYSSAPKKDAEAKESTLDAVTKAVKDGVENSKAKGAYARVETEGEGDKEVVTKITIFVIPKKEDK